MEATRTSQTFLKFYQAAQRNTPEDRHLHNRRRKNLKSHVSIQLTQKSSAYHTVSKRREYDVSGELAADFSDPEEESSQFVRNIDKF
jgi:hypothetical protein